jgi:Rrf2 family nitric oxide-sensitive transcriptional repressor
MKAKHAPGLDDQLIQVLIYLGLARQRPVALAEISEGCCIAQPALLRIVARLTQAGLVCAVAGVPAEFKLVHPPERTTLGTIARQLGARISPPPIFSINQLCRDISAVSAFKSILDEAQRQYWQALEAYTLADVMNGDGLMRKLRFLHPDSHYTGDTGQGGEDLRR